MPIVNRESFPILDSGDGKTEPRYTNHSIAWELRSWKDRNYYYVEYKFTDSFTVFPKHTWISDEDLAKVKSGEYTLMLVNFHESFPDSVENIYQQLINLLNIPAENIILGSGNPDMILEVRRCAEKYNKGEIKVEWFLELEYALWEQKFRRPEFQHRLKTLEKKNYTKAFLNFNRRWRMHRPTMVGLLAAKNLLDFGYVSLAPSDMGGSWQDIFRSVLDFNDEKIKEILLAHKEKILNLPPMYIDNNDLVTNRSFLETSSDQFYEDTYFSLVSETNYYTDSRLDSRGRFITEKTFKCIALEHPFVLITAPKTLPLLHQLGYKTFSPWINEEYDNELDDYRRLEKIVVEVERLCNLSKSELDIFLSECKAVCEHNLKNLMSKKNFAYKINFE